MEATSSFILAPDAKVLEPDEETTTLTIEEH